MSVAYYESTPDSRLVVLNGPLNANRAPDTIRLFRDMVESGIRRVVVDLQGVPFIDGRGLEALIAGYRIFGSDRRNFRLRGVQTQPQLVMDLTGFDQFFEILPHIPGMSRCQLPVYSPRLGVREDLAA